jgi:hypothetical protein
MGDRKPENDEREGNRCHGNKEVPFPEYNEHQKRQKGEDTQELENEPHIVRDHRDVLDTFHLITKVFDLLILLWISLLFIQSRTARDINAPINFKPGTIGIHS